MKRLPYFLLAALGIPLWAALAQTTQSNSPTPQRIIKFLEMSFADPASWSCTRPQVEVLGGLMAQTDFTCLVCTSVGQSGDVAVTRAADGVPETISVASGSEVRVCADVLAVGDSGSASSTPTSGTPTPAGPSTPEMGQTTATPAATP